MDSNILVALKTIHVSCAVLSGTGFFLRGLLMWQQSRYLQQRWVKTLPHIVDSLLLLSALLLAWGYHLSPLQTPWLGAKILGLLLYIRLGMIALHPNRSLRHKRVAWLLALFIFAYIVGAALTKSPWSLLLLGQ